jgi:hypothetical protein
LAEEIGRMLGDAQGLAGMRAACRALYKEDAAERVARVLLGAAEGRRQV